MRPASIASHRRLAFVCLLICGATLADASAADRATLRGTVAESQTGTPLDRAIVRVGIVEDQTDAAGAFTLNDLTPGTCVVSISAVGHQTIQRSVELLPGANALPAIALDATVELSDVIVTAPTSEAQSKFDDKLATEVLSETLFDPSVSRPNAQSGSDVVKDVAGVAVSKGANGTSNVSVRGIDQRMLRITIDGQRQAGSGNPLDSIPAEIVQSLEVTKTFTPDMDGDAVGGVINVNTGGTVLKEGYGQGRHQISYNSFAPKPSTRNSLTFGEPFPLFSPDPNASVLATASFDDQYSTRERISTLRDWTAQVSPGPATYAGESVPVLTLPVIERSDEHRERTGFVLNSDARFGDLALYWRSNFGRDRISRDRLIDDTNPAMGTPLSLTPQYGTFSGVPLSRRTQEQLSIRDAINLSFGGKSTIGANDIDASLAYGRTQEEEPNTLETGFLSAHSYQVTYRLAPDPYAPQFDIVDESDPADSTSASDPGNYRFNYLNVTRSDLDESDASFKFNVRTNFDVDAYVKFGGKIQRRKRSADVDRDVYDAAFERDMNGFVANPQVALETRDYNFGPAPDAGVLEHSLQTQPSIFATNPTRTAINSESGDYNVTEDLWAAYAMGKVRFGRWILLGGARIEGTGVDASANQMELDNDGELKGFTVARSHNYYTEVLPGLHVRFEAEPGVLYRGSLTRSMSRPSNADIAPYRTLSFVDHRSRIGSPNLQPYLATNLDLSIDRYNERHGLVSFAVFYKKIDHFITDAQYPVDIGSLGRFIEFERVNGVAARAMGFELSWQSPTWTLPFGMGRGALEANYSFNHGEAHHPTRPGETFPLPRQVDHQGSIKFHEDHGPMSFDASASYRSGWWEDLIAPGFDNYITEAWDAEMNSSYKFSKAFNVSVGISNLLDKPTRHYAGVTSRMNDWQRNGREISLRAQWKM